MLENGRTTCSCKNTKCQRFGKCIECIKHHKDHNNKLPYCKVPENIDAAKKISGFSHVIW